MHVLALTSDCKHSIASQQAVSFCWGGYMASDLWLRLRKAPCVDTMLAGVPVVLLKQGRNREQTSVAAEQSENAQHMSAT